ncbi:MAG: trypsin-like peptidase domain-containing protein [Myxococcota bacterium]
MSPGPYARGSARLSAACALCLAALGGSPTAFAAEPPPPLTLAACDATPLSLPAQTETALDATLLLEVDRGLGSAVVVSPDGFALTAAHVVAGSAEIKVTTYDGQTASAQIVRLDKAQDIALIKVDRDAPVACSRTALDDAVLGSDAFVLGSPGGEELSFSVSKGIVSGRRNFDGLRFLQLDASVNPGNSGGPVLDDEGRLIGIASWKVSDVTVEGLAFAVPVEVALDTLNLEFGVATDDDWNQTVKLVLPDVAPAPVVNSAVAPDVRRRLAARRALIATGAGLLGSGVIIVAVTAGVRAGADTIEPDQWSSMVKANTVGWVAAGVGAAMVAGGLFIRRNPGRRNAKAADVAIAPAGAGVSVRGRF